MNINQSKLVKQLVLMLFGCFYALVVSAQGYPEKYNVIWDSPSEGSKGSMPIGNGTLGLNVWVEQSGDMMFYLSRTDSWSEYGRLLKLGRVRVKLSPNPFVEGQPFKQELKLEKGEIAIKAGEGDQEVNIHLWPDANSQTVFLEIESGAEINVESQLETWRNEPHEPGTWSRWDGIPRQTTIGDVLNVLNFDQPFEHKQKMVIQPDSVLSGLKNQVMWFHHNQFSTWEIPMKQQGFDSLMQRQQNPLLYRTFGGLMEGPGFVSGSSKTLKSQKSKKSHLLHIHTLTQLNEDPTGWMKTINSEAKKVKKIQLDKRRTDHHQWWSDFWSRSKVELTGTEKADVIAQAYALQRFMNACSGRGPQPIKFNGSIFTVEDPFWGANDPDYRRWGPGYWFQNTRLIYWPMMASGDYDLMQPFFKMYRDALELAKERARVFYNESGAFYVETANFWGTMAADHHGWKRNNRPVSYVGCLPIKRYWEGSLELCAMMLNYYQQTLDEAFAKETMLPILEAVLEFYDVHYPRDAKNTMVIEPAQALETWQDAVNPMPTVAGLHRVVTDALLLPANLINNTQKGKWKQLQAQLPPIPIRTREKSYLDRKGYEQLFPLKDGKPALSPADFFSEKSNQENPEMYAVFPYRLYAFNRPDLELAMRAQENRIHLRNRGWQQHPVQTAYLGLTDDAAELVYERAVNTNEGCRFPAFWGPNYDWIPDQCNGGNLMLGLQAMLMQADGDQIFLFPAWPKNWDVNFKLHAPGNTIIEGSLKNGKLSNLQVLPESRRKNVINMLVH